MGYWNQQEETISREELTALQSERLVWQVKRCYENVECFRNRMDELRLTPDDIHGIEDLPKLPRLEGDDPEQMTIEEYTEQVAQQEAAEGAEAVENADNAENAD